LGIIIDLEMGRGEGVDIREDARKEGDFAQNAPFLVCAFFDADGGGAVGVAVRFTRWQGAVVRVGGGGEVEDVQGGFVGGDG